MTLKSGKDVNLKYNKSSPQEVKTNKQKNMCFLKIKIKEKGKNKKKGGRRIKFEKEEM